MRLACVTVPNFRIALERTRAPELGRTVAIGEPPPGANEIIDCSPEATVLGIRTGMPLRDARTVVPDLVVLPPDPIHYSQSFDRLLDAIEDAEPFVEPGEAGSAFAAIDPNADASAQQDAGERLLHAVQERSGIEASVGVGEGKFIAWIAATVSAPSEVSVVPAGCEQQFLAPLSTSFLLVSYEAQRKLALYNVRTIGEIAAMPIGALQAQFGREGKRLWQLARGIDVDPFLPRRRHEPITATLIMPAPTVNSGAL